MAEITTPNPDPSEQVPDHVPSSWLPQFGTGRWLAPSRGEQSDSVESAAPPAPSQPAGSSTSGSAAVPPPAQEAVRTSEPMRGSAAWRLVDQQPQKRSWREMPPTLRRRLNVFYGGLMLLALFGQIPGLAQLLSEQPAPAGADWMAWLAYYAPAAAFGAVAEFVSSALLRIADWRQIERHESVRLPYVGAGVIAALVAALNVYSHYGSRVMVLFAPASLIAFALWMWRSRMLVRDELRKRGEYVEVPDGTPSAVADRARQLARRYPGYDFWVYLEQAEQDIERKAREVAVRAALAEEMKATGRDGELAVRVLDMDRLAGDVGGRVDYPTIATRLAGRLTADRITTSRPVARSRPTGTDRPTGRPDAPTEAGRPADRSRPTGRPKPVDRKATGRPTGETDVVLAAAYNRLVAEHGREPSGRELAAEAGTSKSTANDWKRRSTGTEADR